MATDVRMVLSTAPDDATARKLAEAVVGEGLAACVSLVPGVWSVYRWKGEVQRDEEVLLVMKTAAARVGALSERVVALHPYQVPEILVLAIEDGHAPYLEWVGAEVGGGR